MLSLAGIQIAPVGILDSRLRRSDEQWYCTIVVMPAQAGIQAALKHDLDSRFRGSDGLWWTADASRQLDVAVDVDLEIDAVDGCGHRRPRH